MKRNNTCRNCGHTRVMHRWEPGKDRENKGEPTLCLALGCACPGFVWRMLNERLVRCVHGLVKGVCGTCVNTLRGADE